MVVKKHLGIDVLEAAKKRVIDAFSKRKPINMSFSGGKDSLVMGDIVLNLINEGAVDKKLLTVTFIDEEAMYDDVIEIVKQWRMRFISAGVKFDWYCLPVKHFNCLNTMLDEETFICWDPRKKNVWVRPMPKFAITDDKFLIPYKDNYQSFLLRKEQAYGMMTMRGVRVAESLQRYKYMARIQDDRYCHPIYDFTDQDIWLYIRKFNIEIPVAYENLYRTGTSTNKLRISQFFSIDTAKSLVNLGEMYPDLMERITKREPNAYLCAMYWDTEMFGKTTRKRKELEKDQEKKDYKKLAFELLRDPNPKYPNVQSKLKSNVLKCDTQSIKENEWKEIYEVLMVGDPKLRRVRAIIVGLFGKEKTK